MSTTIVLQSYCELGMTTWLDRCRSSVQQWCDLQGYEYRFCGDELFDRVPPWYMSKVQGRMPIAADLARLLWIQSIFQETDVTAVAWLDVDMFVMAPSRLTIECPDASVFGYEHWLQKREGRAGYQVRKNVHNAYCAFQPHSTVLPFLIDSILRMMDKVDAKHIAPQFVGPKLLTSLHNIVGFDVDGRFGALSPDFIDALLGGDKSRVDQVVRQQPIFAANLCASLHLTDEVRMNQLIDVLAGFDQGLG